MSPETTPDHQADLRATIGRLPSEPGVYLFEDEAGRVLYVGKATDLRSRVRTYLGRSDSRPLIGLMMRRVAVDGAATTETAEAAL
ncbi:MAG: nucleotide excision repair endonuclease, partial [bacterium]|nr:nucleotide excision repair endonuclease [bacterium]